MATCRGGLWFFLLGVLVLQNSKCCWANADGPSNQLEDDMCANLAKDGKCDAEPELMAKYCAQTYSLWLRAKRKAELRNQNRDVEAIKDKSPSFYELSATTNEGKTIAFETFAGYVTLVAFVPKACDGGVAAEHTLQTLRDIRSTWPMVVEVMAFPFQHPESHYYASELDDGEGVCSTDHYRLAFEKASGLISDDGQSTKALIKSMEEISIHDSQDGQGSKTQHAVYKYFKGVFGFDTIRATSATVFLVSPDGDFAEVFYDGSLKNVKNSIGKQIKHEL